jgi:hypothetical protein
MQRLFQRQQLTVDPMSVRVGDRINGKRVIDTDRMFTGLGVQYADGSAEVLPAQGSVVVSRRVAWRRRDSQLTR